MKKGLLLTLAMATATMSFAQRYSRLPREPRKPSLELGLQLGNPEGHYETVYSGTPAGLNVNLSIPLNRWSPLEIGADMSFNAMGSRSRDIPVTDDWGYATTGDLDVRSSVHSYHAMARFRPFNGRIKPYVDGYYGTKQHRTVMDLDYNNGYENVTLQRDVLESDWTYSYGYGVGLQVEFAPHLNLDIRAQRMNGGGTTMVDRNSVEIFSDGGVGYDVVSTPNSPINLTTVGLTIGF